MPSRFLLTYFHRELVLYLICGLQKQDIDTLVLGCTHYPLLRPILREIVGDQVALFLFNFRIHFVCMPFPDSSSINSS